jgi:hypothetical protein
MTVSDPRRLGKYSLSPYSKDEPQAADRGAPMAETTEAASLGNVVSYVNAARSLAPEIQAVRRDIEHQCTLPPSWSSR